MIIKKKLVTNFIQTNKDLTNGGYQKIIKTQPKKFSTECGEVCKSQTKIRLTEYDSLRKFIIDNMTALTRVEVFKECEYTMARNSLKNDNVGDWENPTYYISKTIVESVTKLGMVTGNKLVIKMLESYHGDRQLRLWLKNTGFGRKSTKWGPNFKLRRLFMFFSTHCTDDIQKHNYQRSYLTKKKVYDHQKPLDWSRSDKKPTKVCQLSSRGDFATLNLGIMQSVNKVLGIYRRKWLIPLPEHKTKLDYEWYASLGPDYEFYNYPGIQEELFQRFWVLNHIVSAPFMGCTTYLRPETLESAIDHNYHEKTDEITRLRGLWSVEVNHFSNDASKIDEFYTEYDTRRKGIKSKVCCSYKHSYIGCKKGHDAPRYLLPIRPWIRRKDMYEFSNRGSSPLVHYLRSVMSRKNYHMLDSSKNIVGKLYLRFKEMCIRGLERSEYRLLPNGSWILKGQGDKPLPQEVIVPTELSKPDLGLVNYTKVIRTSGSSRSYHKKAVIILSQADFTAFYRKNRTFSYRIRNHGRAPKFNNIKKQMVSANKKSLVSMFSVYADKTKPVMAYYLVRKRSYLKKRKVFVNSFKLKIAKSFNRRNKLFHQIKTIYFRSKNRRTSGSIRKSTKLFLSKELFNVGKSKLLLKKKKIYKTHGHDSMNELLLKFL